MTQVFCSFINCCFEFKIKRRLKSCDYSFTKKNHDSEATSKSLGERRPELFLLNKNWLKFSLIHDDMYWSIFVEHLLRPVGIELVQI